MHYYYFRQEKQYFHVQSCVLEVQLILPGFVGSECRELNQSKYRGTVINVDNYLTLKVEVFSYDMFHVRPIKYFLIHNSPIHSFLNHIKYH